MTGEVRKTVTVVFADVVGSTSLTESHDPEAVRAALAQYFEAMRAVLEQHGGTVEKFIGDAVVAFFGIPELHEDDALRAVRAAAALRGRLAALDVDVPLRIRTGVATGEVVADGGETFATGDAVNVAARLEAAAGPGEILLGAETFALVSAAVRTESLEPLDLKGKAEPVAAYRLLEVLPDAPAFTRRFDAPFVGRDDELDRLLAELGRARVERSCRRVVVTGDAGIGKSRLVRELVHAAQDTRVVVGRCLSYGDGITYWPLREIVHQIGGSAPRATLARLLDEQAADAILGAVGLGPVSAQGSEIHWAVRRLLEESAPVVVVLDDLHWAEPTFLDLVDYVHAFSREAAVLLVATGRPELLDVRPAWRDDAIELRALADVEAASLVEALGESLPASVRDRVVDAAEGNPLFVEQLLAFAAETSGELVVPPTIQALLASRIDALSIGERVAAQCAAVEGRLFHRGAVEALMPAEHRADVVPTLLALVRRRLARPDESLFPGDDGFRFAHALVREAAYRSMAKSDRAAAHERYASWLRAVASPGADVDEFVGYHLEQAALLGAEIGAPRPNVADAAAALLAEAGRRAIRRGDVAAAAGLLGRAAVLLPPSADRAMVRAEQAFASFSCGDLPVALDAVRDVLEREDVDAVARARAELMEVFIEMLAGDVQIDEARVRIDTALDTVRAAGDDWWTARGIIVRANTCAMEAICGPAIPLLLPVFDLDGAMADPALRAELLFWFGAALMLGPVRVAEAGKQLQSLAARFDSPLEQAWLDLPLGMLDAYEARFDDARARFGTARTAMQEAGAGIYYASNGMFVAWMELTAGRPAVAEAIAREGWDMLGAAGEQGLRSSVGLHLAQALIGLGRDEEAESTAHEAVALTSGHDRSAQFHHRGLLALVRARAGRTAEAVELARESVAIAHATDSAWHRAEAQVFLAEVAAGDERRAALAELLRLIDEHGFTVYRRHAERLGSHAAERVVPHDVALGEGLAG